MARLNKTELVAAAVTAITADGWAVAPLTRVGEYPARFTISRDGVEHKVRLYIWNLSHGGKSRSATEFRIQITGIDEFQPEPNGRTLILGWSDNFGVFAAFDIQRRLGKLGASPSIQITSATLNAGAADGAASQNKTKGEWALAVRPDKLGRYLQHMTVAHAGDLGPILADEDSEAADPLASELLRLATESKAFALEAAGEAEARARVVAGVDEVLAALDDNRDQQAPQMGHNQPPGPVDENPSLGPQIKTAADDLKAELSSDAPDPRKAGRAAAFLAWAGRLLKTAREEGAKVFEKGAEMAREYMAKALWGAAGTAGVAFKEEIVEMLRHLAQNVLSWLQHISIF